MISRLAWLAALVSTSAIAQKTDSVMVLALGDGQNCTVLEQQLACDDVGTYLKDSRQLSADHSIVVQPGGGQPSIAGVLKAGHSLEVAGYSNVVYKAGFITQPRSSSDAKP